MMLCEILKGHGVHVGLGIGWNVGARALKGKVLWKKTCYLDQDYNVSKMKWISIYRMAVTSEVTFLLFSNFVAFSCIDINEQWKEFQQNIFIVNVFEMATRKQFILDTSEKGRY